MATKPRETVTFGADGQVLVQIAPSKAVKQLPTYGDWLNLLMQHGYAHDDGTGIKPIDQAVGLVVTSDHGNPDRVGIACVACGEVTCPHCGEPGIHESDINPCCEPYEWTQTPATELVSVPYTETLDDGTRKSRRLRVRVSNREGWKMAPIIIGGKVKTRETESLPAADFGIVDRSVVNVEVERQVGTFVSKSGLACRVCQVAYLLTLAEVAKVNAERDRIAVMTAKVIQELKQTMTAEEARMMAGLPSLPQPIRPVYSVQGLLDDLRSERIEKWLASQAVEA